MADILEVSHQRHKYKLVYFDTRGRAEPIRLLFHYFNIKFNDSRIKREDWPKKKAKTPLGFLPYLVVDGGKLVLCESTAIMRYLAKTFRPGFAGRTKSDSARVDMYGEYAYDLISFGRSLYTAKTPHEKEQALKTVKPQIEAYLDYIASHLKKNGGKYIAGEFVTWPDLVLVTMFSFLEDIDVSTLQSRKELVSYYLRMRDLDELRPYITKNWDEPRVQSSKD